MKTTPLSPEDPRLTAYALGEMEEAERLDFEKLLAKDPAAMATVESIRETSRQLESALAAEPMPEMATTDDPYRKPPARVLSFPRFYYIVGGLAAACFAVMVALHEPELKPSGEPQFTYTEIELPALENDTATGDAAQATQPMPLAVHAAEDSVAGARKDADMAFAKVQKLQAAKRSQEMQNFVMSSALMAPPASQRKEEPFNTESYAHQRENGFQRVADHPLSTFSIDVDTASYANVRRFLQSGRLPPAAAVRIEELINYFPYDYAPPTDGSAFAASMEVASAPWAPQHRLVRIGLKGREVTTGSRPAANLVFLLDVSGSMNAPNKLPLVKKAMGLLVERLRADDRVAIVVYAGSSGLALPSTAANRRAEILAAMDQLRSGGSTNGALGIQLAYNIAKANFVPGGLNRVILCTDGDFNVGMSDEGGLVNLIEEKAKSGVFLSVLGFGMGNYQDSKLEQLADKGNGNYGYIDSQREAEKLLVEQINGTLVTIAKDVKIQVEFNPAQVASYRLLGYENRMLNKEDFNNDKVDAGEIGAGHTVTALYEIVPMGMGIDPEVPSTDELKYQPNKIRHQTGLLNSVQSELLTLKVRAKASDGEESALQTFPLTDSRNDFAMASADFKFASAVAGFGMLLRDSELRGTTEWPEVRRWAEAGIAEDAGGYRHEFLGLIEKAAAIPR